MACFTETRHNFIAAPSFKVQNFSNMGDVKLLMTNNLTVWIFHFGYYPTCVTFMLYFCKLILFLRKVFSSTDNNSKPLDNPIQDKRT